MAIFTFSSKFKLSKNFSLLLIFFFLYKLNLYLILKIKFVFNRFFSHNSLSTLSPFLYHFIESPFTSTSLSTFKKKRNSYSSAHLLKKTEFSIPSHQTERLRKKKDNIKIFFLFFFFPFPSPYYHLPFKLYTSGDIISLLSRYLANQHIYLCVIPDSCRQPKKKER